MPITRTFIKVSLSICLLVCVLAGCRSKKDNQKTVSAPPKHKPTPEPAITRSRSEAALSDLAKAGIREEKVKDSKLYQFIQDWYGSPYKYGGCQRSGVDCSCFATILYENVFNKKIGRSSNDIYNSCDKIAIEEAEEGDLLFFKINGNSISHVAVYLRKNYFVHSSTSRGVIINNLDEAYYKKFFFCAGKMKNT